MIYNTYIRQYIHTYSVAKVDNRGAAAPNKTTILLHFFVSLFLVYICIVNFDIL